VALDKDLPHTEIDIPSELEIISISIDKIHLTIICWYRPPYNLDLQSLADYITQATKRYPKNRILLTGDFNFPDIDWTFPNLSRPGSLSSGFLDIIYNFDLTQLITEPTHIKGNTLDLVCTNAESMIYSCQVIQPGLSDHFLVKFSIEMNHSVQDCKNFSFEPVYLYHKANYESFTKSLEELHERIRNLISQSADINLIWNTFTVGIFKALKESVPTKTRRLRPVHEPL
jgi:hypothetical protein